ncbi:hypothetical protein ACIRPT_24215 [Streptomyces sp. NPDC101227]|uniref:hypothetical protein n=1 Tax=Streptomyces sp. NPDC101227 TaxID=3366136 RepID=UPI0037F8BCC4
MPVNYRPHAAPYEGCPKTAVDAEAGPPREVRFSAEDVRIGDDAFVEKSESGEADTDQEDSAQDGHTYRVYIRLGGVIVEFFGARDETTLVEAAAKGAQKVRTLYGIS